MLMAARGGIATNRKFGVSRQPEAAQRVACMKWSVIQEGGRLVVGIPDSTPFHPGDMAQTSLGHSKTHRVHLFAEGVTGFYFCL